VSAHPFHKRESNPYFFQMILEASSESRLMRLIDNDQVLQRNLGDNVLTNSLLTIYQTVMGKWLIKRLMTHATGTIKSIAFDSCNKDTSNLGKIRRTMSHSFSSQGVGY
jgi:hypothetical protein